MWVAARKRGLAGSAINISLSLVFNGCALLGLCSSQVKRSKETQRSSEEPEATSYFICRESLVFVSPGIVEFLKMKEAKKRLCQKNAKRERKGGKYKGGRLVLCCSCVKGTHDSFDSAACRELKVV